MADPDYDNPTFSILDPTDFSQSPSLTLAALLEAWPVNSYPYVVQLPTGSVYIAAGSLLLASTKEHHLETSWVMACYVGMSALVMRI